jgi:hypothetical protein
MHLQNTLQSLYFYVSLTDVCVNINPYISSSRFYTASQGQMTAVTKQEKRASEVSNGGAQGHMMSHKSTQGWEVEISARSIR